MHSERYNIVKVMANELAPKQELLQASVVQLVATS